MQMARALQFSEPRKDVFLVLKTVIRRNHLKINKKKKNKITKHLCQASTNGKLACAELGLEELRGMTTALGCSLTVHAPAVGWGPLPSGKRLLAPQKPAMICVKYLQKNPVTSASGKPRTQRKVFLHLLFPSLLVV